MYYSQFKKLISKPIEELTFEEIEFLSKSRPSLESKVNTEAYLKNYWNRYWDTQKKLAEQPKSEQKADDIAFTSAENLDVLWNKLKQHFDNPTLQKFLSFKYETGEHLLHIAAMRGDAVAADLIWNAWHDLLSGSEAEKNDFFHARLAEKNSQDKGLIEMAYHSQNPILCLQLLQLQQRFFPEDDFRAYVLHPSDVYYQSILHVACTLGNKKLLSEVLKIYKALLKDDLPGYKAALLRSNPETFVDPSPLETACLVGDAHAIHILLHELEMILTPTELHDILTKRDEEGCTLIHDVCVSKKPAGLFALFGFLSKHLSAEDYDQLLTHEAERMGQAAYIFSKKTGKHVEYEIEFTHAKDNKLYEQVKNLIYFDSWVKPKHLNSARFKNDPTVRLLRALNQQKPSTVEKVETILSKHPRGISPQLRMFIKHRVYTQRHLAAKHSPIFRL